MFLPAGSTYHVMSCLTNPFFLLNPFIQMPVPFSEKKFFFFPPIFGILSKGATIVLTKMMIQPVPVLCLCLCRSLEIIQQKTGWKIIKIRLKTSPYSMCWRKKRQARSSRQIWSSLPLPRPRITRGDPLRIARLLAASSQPPRRQVLGWPRVPRAGRRQRGLRDTRGDPLRIVRPPAANRKAPHHQGLGCPASHARAGDSDQLRGRLRILVPHACAGDSDDFWIFCAQSIGG